MLASHVSEQAKPFDRGFAFGRRNGVAVRSTLVAYERMFEATRGIEAAQVRALGRGVGDALQSTLPEIVDEIAGIAAGAGVDAEGLLAANARTEILAGDGPPECSVIGVLPQRSAGATVLAQNWDWHPDLANSLVVWSVVEPGGRSFTTLTEAGILAKIGLNDRGLGLCLNILGSSLDGGIGGTPVHVLCRLILQRAGGLRDAHAILAGAAATASSCFSIARAAPEGCEMASFELSPAGIAKIEPKRGVLLHTNHFLGPLDRGEDRIRREWPDTELRLRELDERLRNAPGSLEPGAVKAVLRSHDAGRIAVCCHDADNPRRERRQATLASVCMRLERRRIEVTEGAPCRAPFRAFGMTAAPALSGHA